jgi:hypothetical protein
MRSLAHREKNHKMRIFFGKNTVLEKICVELLKMVFVTPAPMPHPPPQRPYNNDRDLPAEVVILTGGKDLLGPGSTAWLSMLEERNNLCEDDTAFVRKVEDEWKKFARSDKSDKSVHLIKVDHAGSSEVHNIILVKSIHFGQPNAENKYVAMLNQLEAIIKEICKQCWRDVVIHALAPSMGKHFAAGQQVLIARRFVTRLQSWLGAIDGFKSAYIHEIDPMNQAVILALQGT